MPCRDVASPPRLRFYLPPLRRFSLYASCRVDGIGSSKHGIALPFIDSLKDSVLRTSDIREANITVLPALIDWYARGRCSGSWSDHLRNLTAEATQLRRQSPQTPQMVLAADFKACGAIVSSLRRALPLLRIGTYLGTRGERKCAMASCAFAVGYMNDVDAFSAWRGRSWNVSSAVAFDNVRSTAELLQANRTLQVEFAGQADHRPAYRQRLDFVHNRDRLSNGSWVTTPTPTLRCNASSKSPLFAWSGLRACNASAPGDRLYCSISISHREMYEVRAEARYSLMLRGDDASSDRLQNALMTLTVPVVLGEVPPWLPFSWVVPWRKMVVRVGAANFFAHPAAVLSALSREVGSKQALIAQHLCHFAFWPEDSLFHRNILWASVRTVCPASDVNKM